MTEAPWRVTNHLPEERPRSYDFAQVSSLQYARDAARGKYLEGACDDAVEGDRLHEYRICVSLYELVLDVLGDKLSVSV